MRLDRSLALLACLVGASALAACDGLYPHTARALNPDDQCWREKTVWGPDNPNDMAVLILASDGTCWRFSRHWQGLQDFDRSTGGSGVPEDPDWCEDEEWFFEQPACDPSERR